MRAARAGIVAALAALVVLVAAAPVRASRLIDIRVPTDHVRFAEEPGGDWPDRKPGLRARVLLPDHYDKSRRYPVLYLLHGANSYYRSFEERMDYPELAEDFPGIVVTPDGGTFGMYTDWYNGGEFGRPRWMTYHLTDLRRVVNERFRIRKGRRWHAIAGVSMGGMGAVRYAAADPGYFGSVASYSGVALDTQAPYIVAAFNPVLLAGGAGATYDDIWGPPHGYYATGTNPQRLIPNLRQTRTLVTSGDGTACPEDPAPVPLDTVTEIGARRLADDFVTAARGAGVDITEIRRCGAHTNPTAERALIDGFEWGFFEPGPRLGRSWTYKTVSPGGRMPGLRFRFAAQPTEAIRFARAGSVLSAEGSGTVRIRGAGCDRVLTLPFEARLKC